MLYVRDMSITESSTETDRRVPTLPFICVTMMDIRSAKSWIITSVGMDLTVYDRSTVVGSEATEGVKFDCASDMIATRCTKPERLKTWREKRGKEKREI